MSEPVEQPMLAFAKPEVSQADIEAVVRVLESGWLTTGRENAAFESELADWLGIEHVVAVSSCTTAEEIALAYLDLPTGSKVAVPAWTFVSSSLAIERAGLTPMFVDVLPSTLNMDPMSLEAAIDAGIGAVVGVHYAGTPLSAEIRSLCVEASLPLVEDAAHAFGSVDDRGRIAGQSTAGACFSFYATKNLTTGEGGALATDQSELAAFARQYRLHGMSTDAVNRYRKPGAHTYDVTMPGLKANMPDMLAALGRSQLARFEASQTYRRSLVNQYRSELGAASLRFVPDTQEDGSADHLMVLDLLSDERAQRVLASLAAAKIGSSVHFRPLQTFSWYLDRPELVGPSGLSVAGEVDGRIISLPLHVNMTSDDVARVCSVVLDALR